MLQGSDGGTQVATVMESYIRLAVSKYGAMCHVWNVGTVLSLSEKHPAVASGADKGSQSDGPSSYLIQGASAGSVGGWAHPRVVLASYKSSGNEETARFEVAVVDHGADGLTAEQGEVSVGSMGKLVVKSVALGVGTAYPSQVRTPRRTSTSSRTGSAPQVRRSGRGES